jgi:hypothetical protein
MTSFSNAALSSCLFCMSILSTSFFMRTHLILQLVWGVESISRRLLLCTKYQ